MNQLALLAVYALAAAVAVAGAAAVPAEKALTGYYHSDVGIPEAQRIKEAELGTDLAGSRITGGSLAELGDYPYMVGLDILLTNGAKSVCGSSMISNTRAVTAGHCWWDGKNQARLFTMVFGSTKLYSGGTRVETSSVTTHESYTTETLNNDVAIIKFNYVAYTDVIQPIDLPDGFLMYSDFAGFNVEAIGFGYTSDWASITTEQALSHVTLQVITNDQCRQQFPFPSVVIESTLCTSGTGGRSTCSGDSGGPLVLFSDGNPVLVGITSFGLQRQCTRGLPVGFTRVTSYLDWIEERM